MREGVLAARGRTVAFRSSASSPPYSSCGGTFEIVSAGSRPSEPTWPVPVHQGPHRRLRVRRRALLPRTPLRPHVIKVPVSVADALDRTRGASVPTDVERPGANQAPGSPRTLRTGACASRPSGRRPRFRMCHMRRHRYLLAASTDASPPTGTVHSKSRLTSVTERDRIERDFSYDNRPAGTQLRSEARR